MKGHGWSIRSSAGALFAGTASVFLVVAGIVLSGAYFLIMASELDEELLEVIASMKPRLEEAGDDRSFFSAAVGATISSELETPMAWRLRGSNGEVLHSVGPASLLAVLAATPEGVGPLEVWRPTLTTRQTFVALPGSCKADAILDGAGWLGRTRIFAASMGAVAILGSLLSLLVGRAFGRRISELVTRVADEVSTQGDQVELSGTRTPGTPVEVRAVALAMEARLLAHRTEMERSQILVAGLAHDLRAPVQALLTSTQVALMEGGGTDPGKVLQRHLSEIRSLARAIDNIMEWGAPRHAAAAATSVAFDLRVEVRDRLRGEEEAAARKGVFLDRIEKGELAYSGSPDSIVLAIRNLVGNAIDWSAPGGEVTLTLEGRADRIVISVEDQGPGFQADEIDRLFEPFIRGVAAPGKRAGYGLGLAIVAAVARRHGGEVTAGNRPPKPQGSLGATPGARVIMTLPK
ncbi:Sensor protein CpxA [Planctomycetes bacterium Poly30]|uniref:histidine kinase n=1 Tax=Saltatorellus ferox TaxID=2528018 RepID=A0A518EPZ6_9BACT|nr:Sensor protein CpxA [Planctomycetes bacterium Poly30]